MHTELPRFNDVFVWSRAKHGQPTCPKCTNDCSETDLIRTDRWPNADHLTRKHHTIYAYIIFVQCFSTCILFSVSWSLSFVCCFQIDSLRQNEEPGKITKIDFLRLGRPYGASNCRVYVSGAIISHKHMTETPVRSLRPLSDLRSGKGGNSCARRCVCVCGVCPEPVRYSSNDDFPIIVNRLLEY